MDLLQDYDSDSQEDQQNGHAEEVSWRTLLLIDRSNCIESE